MVAAALVAVADVPWNQAVVVQAPVVQQQLLHVVADVPLLPLHAVADVVLLWNQAVVAKAPVVQLQLQAADVLRLLQAADVQQQLQAVDVQLQQLPAVADALDVVAAVDFCRESVTVRVAVAEAAVADVLLQLLASHPADVRKPLV
ncbi:MAG: hypothetical protein AAF497_01785 [Planctomycetota bacterium]